MPRLDDILCYPTSVTPDTRSALLVTQALEVPQLISLEREVWAALTTISTIEHQSLQSLVTLIEVSKVRSSQSTVTIEQAVRLFVVSYLHLWVLEQTDALTSSELLHAARP